MIVPTQHQPHACGPVLAGDDLERFQAVDALVGRIAEQMGATPVRLSPLMTVADLGRAGYLSSFPHLSMLAAHVAEEQQAEFAAKPSNRLGEVDGGRLDATGSALTPAACTPLYAWLRGKTVDRGIYTTRNTCFRHEATVDPLRRQHAFTMREIVIVGSPLEVADRLNQARALLGEALRRVPLALSWQSATDPFFGSDAATRQTMQAATEAKQELVFDGLALASVNRHGDHFGRAFEIASPDGTAHSACLAFGLERWVHALRTSNIDLEELTDV